MGIERTSVSIGWELDKIGTWEKGTEAPARGGATAGVLGQTGLQEEDRDPYYTHEDQVGDEERPTPVPVAQVGETPEVAQAHGVPETAQTCNLCNNIWAFVLRYVALHQGK